MFIIKYHRNITNFNIQVNMNSTVKSKEENRVSPIDAGKSFIRFSRNTRTVNC